MAEWGLVALEGDWATGIYV